MNDIRPSRARRWTALPLLALASASSSPFALPALAKSYTIGPVVIEAQVKPDGSMSVVEQRSFDFSGDFSRVVLGPGDQGRTGGHPDAVEEVVDGQARPLAPTTRRPRRPTARAPTTSTLGGADVGQHLLPQVRRAGHVPAELRRGERRAALPGHLGALLAVHRLAVDGARRPTSPSPSGRRSRSSKDQVQAWAHGPLTGEVAIGPDGVVDPHRAQGARGDLRRGPGLYPASALPAAPSSTSRARRPCWPRRRSGPRGER